MGKRGQVAISTALHKAKINSFRNGIDISLWLMTIALNEDFGFGKKRLERLQDKFNELFKEYGNSIEDDLIYGNAKLKRRINKIMREEVFK